MCLAVSLSLSHTHTHSYANLEQRFFFFINFDTGPGRPLMARVELSKNL